MVRHLGLAALAALGLFSCFDFRADLARCQTERRCPLEDGGWFLDGGEGTVTGGLCAQGACWEHPFPVGVPLTALHAVSESEYFAGGAGGVALHVKGAQGDIAFLGRPVPPTIDWKPVTGLAECSTGMSAMTGERLLFGYGESGFSPVALPPQGQYPSVAQGATLPGPTCVWVGNNLQSPWVAEEKAGKVTGLDSPGNASTFWRRMRGIAGTSGQDLWLASETEVWTRSEDGGVRFDDVPIPDAGVGVITGICTLGAGGVFISTTTGLRARETGWSLVGDTRSFAGVACLSSGEVAAAGPGLVRRCAPGGACVDVEADGGWQVVSAVGGSALVGSRAGEVALLPAGATALSSLAAGTRAELSDVAVGADGTVWAVGREATLLRRTPQGWVQVDAGVAATDNLYGVRVLGDGRVVYGGTNGVLRVLQLDGGVSKPKLYYAGGAVVQNQSLGKDLLRFREVNGVPYALGTRGAILREDPEGNWREVSTAALPYSTNDYYDLQQGPDGVMWLTGGGAFSASSADFDAGWRTVRGPFSNYTFLTLFIDSRGAVWFAGRNSLGARYTPDAGDEAFTFPGAGGDTIIGFVEQPDALYAIGQRSLYRYAGEPLQWEMIGPLPLDPSANALMSFATTADDLFVVGKGGAVLRVNRAQWLQSP